MKKKMKNDRIILAGSTCSLFTLHTSQQLIRLIYMQISSTHTNWKLDRKLTKQADKAAKRISVNELWFYCIYVWFDTSYRCMGVDADTRLCILYISV